MVVIVGGGRQGGRVGSGGEGVCGGAGGGSLNFS